MERRLRRDATTGFNRSKTPSDKELLTPTENRAKIAELRPEYAVPDPADRLVHPPGFQIQCGLWFPHEDLPLGHDQAAAPPVLVMTSTFSGFIQARMETEGFEPWYRLNPAVEPSQHPRN